MSQPVAVVIVNWNSGDRLVPAIRSVAGSRDVVVEEIVVVDNASSDGSAAVPDAAGPPVRLIRSATNLGFAGGVNRGFAETRAPFVLVLNPDVTPDSEAIARLASVLKNHPRTKAVRKLVSDRQRSDRYAPRPLPNTRSLMLENLGIGAGSSTVDGTEPRRVEQPAASALMIRREAYDRVGGFDERFHPAWYEDVDFARSLAADGWEAWVAPDAGFEHEGGYSALVLGTERFMAAYYTNQIRYARKHLGAGATLGLKAALLVGTLGRSLARPRRFGAYWRGFLRVVAA